jgi:hypothetical protein
MNLQGGHDPGLAGVTLTAIPACNLAASGSTWAAVSGTLIGTAAVEGHRSVPAEP